MTRQSNILDKDDRLVTAKLLGLPWGFIALLFSISGMGFIMLYSVGLPGGDDWAIKQMTRFAAAIPLMMLVAVTDIRVWYQFAYIAYIFGLALLGLTEVMGTVGGLGAQRWLSIGGVQFQPAEVAKVGMVLALARYYHRLHPNNIQRLRFMFLPLMLIGLAAVLVLKQPNLGTAIIMCGTGAILLFLGGVRLKIFFIGGILACAMLPVLWSQMHDYQKQRVYTFLDPEKDPLGAGYNIIQSKIAIGSGGFSGKGLTHGSQSQLSFVPEKHTDFIFSTLAEELGFWGGTLAILLYGALAIAGLRIAARCQNTFGRITASGVVTLMFLHVFINTGMVMGILPVVGVPLPLLSYGGTSLIATLVGFGFVLNAHVHRDMKFA